MLDCLLRSRLNSSLKGTGDDMNRGTHFLVTSTASLISNHNRKKTIQKIKRMNDANKRIIPIGRVWADNIFPEQDMIANVCITGGTQEARNSLLLQNCKQSVANGIPVLILHEGNYHLDYDVKQAFQGKYYCRTISKSEPFYEPLMRLSDQEIANLLIEASKEDDEIGTDGSCYLKAIASIARKKGINPYTRMLSSFPYAQSQMVIAGLESKGNISPMEASTLRNDILTGAGERSRIDKFFSELMNQSDIVAGKSQLARSTSISECIRNRGVLIMDVGTCSKKTLLSFIRAELEKCVKDGRTVRVMIDAMTLADSPKLLDLLGKTHATFWWTLSTPDMNTLVNAGKKLTSWIALTHKTIIFANSLGTSEALSEELGDYDYVEVTSTHGGGTDFGNFGLHFGATDTVQTTTKREKVVKPEDISTLGEREFYVLNNNTSEIMKGMLM